MNPSDAAHQTQTATDPFASLTGVAAICAHPDDESFGLGAILSTLAHARHRTDVLCFTHGEASTLDTTDGDLATIRAHELKAAANTLGVTHTHLLHYPDGKLDDLPLHELTEHVQQFEELVDADTLLVFDHGGITGHPDHQRATDAAIQAAITLDLAVLAWTLPAAVAEALNNEFQSQFVGRARHEIDLQLTVDRTQQLAAIRHHQSQSADNPVLWRRLDLLGHTEHLRYLRRVHTSPAPAATPTADRHC